MDVSLHQCQDLDITINVSDGRLTRSCWIDLVEPGSGSEVTLFFRQDDRSSPSTSLDVLVDFTERLHDEAVRARDEIREALLSADDADLPVTCLHCSADVVFDDAVEEWAHDAQGGLTSACAPSPDSDHAEPDPEDLARIERTQPAQSTTTTLSTPTPLGPPDDSWAHDDEG